MAVPTAVIYGLRKSYFTTLKAINLKSVKRINFKFDPFRKDVTSIRDFLFGISSTRIRSTNSKCSIKTEVVNDRSEPLIDVELDNGHRIIFKTHLLTALEIAQEYNRILEQLVPKPVEASQSKVLDIKKRKK